MAAVTVHSDFGAQGKKIYHCFHFPLSICHEMMKLDAMILVFCMLSFKPTFSLFLFTLIKRLFSFSSLSAFSVVPSAYHVGAVAQWWSTCLASTRPLVQSLASPLGDISLVGLPS